MTAGKTVAYTGAYGSTAQNATASVSDNGNSVTFTTTRPLGPHQGLTVDVAVPKGAILPPTQSQQLEWFLRDRLGAIIGIGGAGFVLLYYLIAWMRVGRDPRKGVIVPRWDAPEGISPALSHFIWHHGFRRQGFPALSAATISLAVKGYLEIDNRKESLTLRRTDKPTTIQNFPAGEQAVLRRVPQSEPTLEISKKNGSEASSLSARTSAAPSKASTGASSTTTTGVGSRLAPSSRPLSSLPHSPSAISPRHRWGSCSRP